jgi:NAD(P)-dependent dehydrogenase (short-subunit alcohol dehydrogenase family)
VKTLIAALSRLFGRLLGYPVSASGCCVPARGSLNVLVTGASSGLGEELAYGYARGGHAVALLARRKERLEAVAARCRELGARDAVVLTCDTTARDQVRDAVAALDARFGQIDRAYLNAGGSGDKFKRKRAQHYMECCTGDDLTAIAFSAESAEWVMRLNYLAVVYWLEPLLARMRRQGHGTIAITGSVAADGNLPRSGPYTASKLSLRALLQGLRYDARKFGVRLCLIECGYFVSELTDPASGALFLLETADAAARAMKGVEAGKGVIRFPWQMSLVSRVCALGPRWIRDWFWDRRLPPLREPPADDGGAGSREAAQ